MHKEKILKKLGRNIAKLRELKGFSQDDVAAERDVARATMHRIETGQTDPKVGTLIEIADALGVPLKQLFEFD